MTAADALRRMLRLVPRSCYKFPPRHHQTWPDVPKSYKYHYRRYNEFDVVKVNIPTIAATLFMARHVLGLFVIGIAFSRTSFDTRGAFNDLFDPILMLADIPAIFLLLAMVSRHPKSGAAIRGIWRHGPHLLLASAVIYVVLLIDLVDLDVARLGWAVWLSIAVTAAAVTYVFASPYAHELFRQFPEAPDDGQGPAKPE